MGFGLVQRLDGDERNAALGGEAFGVAARLAAHEERDFLQFLFRVPGPAAVDRLRWRGGGLGGAVAEMGRGGLVVELEVFAEHVHEVFLKPHHQRVHPFVEDHIGAFEAHLRRIASREALHMHRRGNDRTGKPQLLGDVALHLRAENEFRLKLRHLGLDLKIIVGDQRLDAKLLGSLPHGPCKLA